MKMLEDLLLKTLIFTLTNMLKYFPFALICEVRGRMGRESIYFFLETTISDFN